MQIGPWPVLGRGTGKGGRIPARWVAGGEGKEVREVKWARENLLMGLGEGLGVGWCSSALSREQW